MSLTERLTIICLMTVTINLLPFNPVLGQGQGIDEHQLFLEQLHEAHRQIIRADLSLIKQMHTVADQIKVYLKNKKSSPLIPDTSETNAELAKFLSSTLPQNPYVPDRNNSRVKVKLDPSISLARVKGLRAKQPGDWQASPGTISVIHNGYDLFVIWGANFRGMPVKKHQLKPSIKPGVDAKIISIKLKF